MTAKRGWTKAKLVKAWRKHGYGRLYWRTPNQFRWRDWESDAVACVVDTPARTWYFTLDALIDDLESFMPDAA